MEESGQQGVTAAAGGGEAPSLGSSRFIAVPISATDSRNFSSRHVVGNKCFPVDAFGNIIEDGGFLADSGVPPPEPLARKLGAEVFGTFLLMIAAVGSAIIEEKTKGGLGLMGLGGAPGLTVLALILATGHISGAHFNPAVTIAFATLKHFPWVQVPLYIIAQVVGSVAACYLLKLILHPDLSGGVTVPAGDEWRSFLMEFLLTFDLMFVVTSVATDTRAIGELAALAVGATVFSNVLIGGAISGASMNPVRTLGPAIASGNYRGIWLYMVGTPLGALGGAGAYTAIKLYARSRHSHQENGAAPPRISFQR